MARPDWCPQDVWAAAITCAETVCRNLDYDDVTIEVTAIARAILAERERAAKVCDDEIELARHFGPHHVPIISSVRRKIVEPA